jgi:NitT/TauT family transport system ATP-binding protein
MNLSVESLTFCHMRNGQGPLKVLDDVSFRVEAGTIVCVVGPSGCGKTTILNLVAGLLPAQKGVIKFEDGSQEVGKPRVGYMFQRDLMFPWLTVLDNAMLGIRVRGDDSRISKEDVCRQLEAYGLQGFENSYPHELSGGMRQRVALLRTLAPRNDLVLLDEPLTSIDYATRLQLEQSLFDHLVANGIPALVVTHDVESAVALGDEILVLSPRPSTVSCVHKTGLARQHGGPIAAREAAEFGQHFAHILKAYRLVKS